MASQNSVSKLYQSVIDDVINNVRESFLDEGVDDQVLQELKHIWESKLAQSKALEQPAESVLVNPYASRQGEHISSTMSASAQAAAMALPDGILAYHPQHITLPTATGGATHAFPAYQMAQVAPGGQTQIVYQQVPIQNVAAMQAQQGATSTLIHQQLQQQTMQPQQQQQQQQQQRQQQQIIGHQVQSRVGKPQVIIQVDGGNDTSSDDDDDDDDDENGYQGYEKEEDDDEDEKEENGEGAADEEPLNSDDDVSDQDPNDLFDTDNVVVCQYDKISRNRNRWKFHLKDGIMNLNTKDYVFQKGTGDAEW